MHLGELQLPKSEWKRLSFILENMLSGQQTLLEERPEITTLATKLLEDNSFLKQRQINKSTRESKEDFKTIDLQSITTTNSRSLGPELVANTFWEKLKFDEILSSCKTL